MITAQEILPSRPLAEYVRFYQYSETNAGNATLFKPLPGRPEQSIQFSFRDAYVVRDRMSGKEEKAPPTIVQGRQTKRYIDVLATGDVYTFTIHFQPTGFFRLFHIPLPELTNWVPDALDVIGPEIGTLYHQLGEADDPQEMACLAERYLLKKWRDSQPFHPVQRAAVAMLNRRGVADLSELVAECNVSLRQFERTFSEQVGVPPKLYCRLLRFTHALELKNKEPSRTWTEIAHEVGYYDQMHLVHDCKDFADETPSTLIETWIPCRK